MRQDESDNEAEAEAEAESSGSTVTGASHGSNGLDNSGSAADNVSIQMSERSKEDGVSKQRCSFAAAWVGFFWLGFWMCFKGRM